MRNVIRRIVVPLACTGLGACQYSGTVNGPGTMALVQFAVCSIVEPSDELRVVR